MKTIKTIMATIILATFSITNANASSSHAKSPWQSHSKIKFSAISPVYKQEWRKSSYQTCPILALPNNAIVQKKNTTSRAANFSDGWGVAYDIKNGQGKPLRGAYGVANAGKTSLSSLYSWPEQWQYEDGSYVTLGHEGNDPKGKYLAYIVLKNGCFYNVWSQISKQNLNIIISQLRYVK